MCAHGRGIGSAAVPLSLFHATGQLWDRKIQISSLSSSTVTVAAKWAKAVLGDVWEHARPVVWIKLNFELHWITCFYMDSLSPPPPFSHWLSNQSPLHSSEVKCCHLLTTPDLINVTISKQKSQPSRNFLHDVGILNHKHHLIEACTGRFRKAKMMHWFQTPFLKLQCYNHEELGHSGLSPIWLSWIDGFNSCSVYSGWEQKCLRAISRQLLLTNPCSLNCCPSEYSTKQVTHTVTSCFANQQEGRKGGFISDRARAI